MLKLQEVAEFVTKELNKISSEYKFEINAELASNNQNNTIKGILRSETPILPPVADVINVDYKLSIALCVPTSMTNFHLINVENVIGEFARIWNGKSYKFSCGSGTITISLTKTGEFKTESRQGNFLPLIFNLNINYNENVILSGSKVWLLNDIVIPYTNENIILEKTGKTNMINGKEFNQTLLTSQMKYYHFVFPYTDSDLCKMLQQDILTGSANKTYTLKYYDGLAFTKDKPFTTLVSIFKNADTGSERPKNGVFNLTFADADDGSGNTKYYLALIDWQFDNQTENTRYFGNQEEQRIYFDGYLENDGQNGLIRAGAEWEEIKAPNLDSIDLTGQYYRNSRNYDLFDLVNKNYAIIKVVRNVGKDNEKTSYFFYWTNNAQIGAENQIFYDLKLDTVQTYLFNPNINFTGSLIQQAHLDRWIDNGDGTVSFNGRADSKLFEREEIKDVAKRLVYREKLIFDVSDLELPNVKTYPNIYEIQSTDVWCYIFIDGKPIENIGGKDISISYNFCNFNEVSGVLPQGNLDRAYSRNISEPTAILAYPLDSDKYLGEIDGIKLSTYSGAFAEFVEANPTIFSYIKAIKLSIKPPININELKYTGKLKLNDNKFSGEFLYDSKQKNVKGEKFPVEFVITGALSSNSQSALIYIKYDNLTPFKMKMQNSNILPKLTFNKENLQDVNRDKIYNPKLNSSDYKEIILNIAGSQYSFDFQKLNDENPKFTYLEPLTCDNTNAIIRYVSNDKNNVFNDFYSDSYNGFIYKNDLSLPIANDKLSQYLADNKNAYLSFHNQQKMASDQFAINASLKALGSLIGIENPLNNASNAFGVASGALSLGLQQKFQEIQYNLSIDNMKNSPQSLSNINGSVLLVNAICEYGVYFELHEGLKSELEMANEIMFQNGYVYNQFGNVKDFMNIRKYFNYVKAVIGSIDGIPLSNSARADLRQRFASGIRFWNSDNVQYELENYELSLEN